MRKFTIELDEMVCKWLEHISELTDTSVENVIANGIYNQVIAVKDNVFNTFAGSRTDGAEK